MLASIRPEWRSREVGEVRERFSTPMESPWHMVVGYGTRHEVTRLSYVLLHYRNHVMTRYYGLHYGYRSFVRGNYRPGQMLDAIIIAGLRSWRRVERERERWVSFFFFGNGIFILKSVDFSWNLHRNLYSKPLGDGRIFVYIVTIIGVS